MPGLVRYGYTDEGSTNLDIELVKIRRHHVAPQYDPSGVNVYANKHTMVIEGVFSESTEDLFVQKTRTLRQLLRHPRLPLVIATEDDPEEDDQFYIRIEPDQNQEIDNGPKPIDLEMSDYVANLTCHLIWTVEFTLRECGMPDNKTVPSVLYKTYEVDFSFDNGRLTRTISGQCRIADNAVRDVENTECSKTALSIVGAIYIPPPMQWRRTRARFGISSDGMVLKYEFVDVETQYGWMLYATDLEASWTESRRAIPFSVMCTLDVRVKGRRNISKKKIIQSIITPIIKAKFGSLTSILDSAVWRENLLDNEIHATINKRMLPNDSNIASGTLDDFQDYVQAPGPTFAVKLSNSPQSPPGEPSGKKIFYMKGRPVNYTNSPWTSDSQIGFDEVLGQYDINESRWENLPHLSRLIVKFICDRIVSTMPSDYKEPTIDDSGIEMSLFTIDPSELSDPSQYGQKRLPNAFINGYQYESGAYVLDEEVIGYRLNNRRSIIGNVNLFPVDSQGKISPSAANVEEVAYQSDTPQVVYIVKGRALRIMEPAEPLPIPELVSSGQSGSGTAIQLIALSQKVDLYGPFPMEGGRYAAYGAIWKYVLSRPLTQEEILLAGDAEDNPHQLIYTKIPRPATRANAIFQQGFLSPKVWNERS